MNWILASGSPRRRELLEMLGVPDLTIRPAKGPERATPGAGPEQTVRELALPVVEEQGCKLWDVEYVREAGQWYLRIYIDKDGGVSIDDCVDLTHAVTKPLDEADPISQSYMLEVSSPGVERELTKDSHFEKYIGSPVMLRSIRPIDGVRDFNGKMVDYKDKKITLRLEDDSEITFDKKDISYVKLDDFNIDDFNQEI